MSDITQEDRDTLKTAGEIINRMLLAGEDIKLPGIGKFKLTTSSARKGRNPRTGEPIDIPSKTIVKFAPTERIREELATVEI